VNRRTKVVAGAAAGLAAAGGGAAIAATQFSPKTENEAVISDAAKQLGVQPSDLSKALKKALEDRVDAAVAAGRLTKEQGDELKSRVESGDFPLFGFGSRGPGLGFFGHFGPFHHLDAAASYLGLTEAQLRSNLDSGETLAQIAKDQGKSVDGLVSALVDGAKQRLDAAVKDGRITQAQENQILSDLKSRITDFVNGKFFFPRRAGGPFGGFVPDRAGGPPL
jgi:uncharacterized protein YidB (DUF937 family)